MITCTLADTGFSKDVVRPIETRVYLLHNMVCVDR